MGEEEGLGVGIVESVCDGVNAGIGASKMALAIAQKLAMASSSW